jgi:hypothetical protein
MAWPGKLGSNAGETDESKSKMVKKSMNNRTEDVQTYKTKFLKEKRERTKGNARM